MIYKKDFPILQKDIIYLDSASTTQKPSYVIQWVNNFIMHEYANIHRWSYELAEKSEELYEKSKINFAKIINANKKEIIYTYNATYAFNILIGSLDHSNFLQKGDVVLLSIQEHHANIVPRQILKEKIGIEIEFIDINKDYHIDFEDFKKKYTSKVKVISITAASNVTWSITDLLKISSLIKEETLFFIDASQYLPHYSLDVKVLWCDALIATGHKMLAYTWLWMLYIEEKLLKKLKPSIGGGGSIEDVSNQSHSLKKNYEKFEIWTPNVIAAVSLLKAIEYITTITYENIQKHEISIIKYCLSYFKKFENEIELIWTQDYNSRVGVFSFRLRNKRSQSEIADLLSMKNICIRAGGHCAHPLFKYLNIDWACRMSCYLYTEEQDIDIFFDELQKLF